MTENTEKKPRISALSAGFQFSVCVLIAMALGTYADKRLECKPWGVLGGMVLGMLIATWSVLRPLWIEANDADRAPKPPKTDDEL
jgi:F0F1-type ATP synthase assembly protein I